jgi:hypothetical protein
MCYERQKISLLSSVCTEMASAVRGAVGRGARAVQRASSVGGVRLHAARMPAVAAACASMPSVRAQCSRSIANVGGKSGSGWRWDGAAKSGWWGPRAAAALFGGCGFVAATYGALAVVDCEADNSDEVITSYLVPAASLQAGSWTILGLGIRDSDLALSA